MDPLGLEMMTERQLQDVIDRARRYLREKQRQRRRGSKYVLDSQRISETRWTKELVPCGNQRCKRCREREEFHGPYFKPWRYDPDTGRTKPVGKPQREAPEGWSERDAPHEPVRSRRRPYGIEDISTPRRPRRGHN